MHCLDRRVCFYATLLIVSCVFCHPVKAQKVPGGSEIEAALKIEADKLLNKLRSYPDVKAVGVLKFALKHKGQHKWPASVGTLNQTLADKTEIALVWANPAKENEIKRQVVVVKNATEIASCIEGASHLNDPKTSDISKREKLFSKKYPVVWKVDGNAEVVPDAFIFGMGEIHKDLKTITLELIAFRRFAANEDIKVSHQFTTTLHPEDIREMGEGYVRQNEIPGNKQDDVFSHAVTIREKTESYHPLKDEKLPLKLQVFYDGVPQEIKYLSEAQSTSPGAKIAEPTTGQRVILKVSKRNPNDKNRYGVLLRINGENTLYRQRLRESKSTPWVFESDAKEITISGFQNENGTRQPFIVKAGKEMLDAEAFYGNNIGLISLTVFQERNKNNHAAVNLKADEILDSIRNNSLPKKPSENISALRSSLATSVYNQTRGVIVPDEKNTEASKLDFVDFKWDTNPIFSASIRYYHPVNK